MEQQPGTRHRMLLRAATRAQHCALDQQLAMLDFAEVVAYRSFLEASAAAVLPLEALLSASNVAAHLADWPQRCRTDSLCEDVRALGGSIDPLPLDAKRLTPAQMFGVLYVLEGSRLGARVLLQRVPPDIGATRYLSAGDATLWPSFLASLDEVAFDAAPALHAAVATFALFQEAFARCAGQGVGRSSLEPQ